MKPKPIIANPENWINDSARRIREND